MKDGQPFLVTGTPGGDNHAINTMQTLVNIIDFDMNIQQVIEAPRWSTRSFPASPFPTPYIRATSRSRTAFPLP
jgi:gamma-glutamyltranspeptidase/glutathione hydrolase